VLRQVGTLNSEFLYALSIKEHHFERYNKHTGRFSGLLRQQCSKKPIYEQYNAGDHKFTATDVIQRTLQTTEGLDHFYSIHLVAINLAERRASKKFEEFCFLPSKKVHMECYLHSAGTRCTLIVKGFEILSFRLLPDELRLAKINFK
jgi:hypothetical protein